MRVGECFARIASVSSRNARKDPSLDRNNDAIVSASRRREASRTPSHRATDRWNGVAEVSDFLVTDCDVEPAEEAKALFLFVSSSAPLLFPKEDPEEAPSSSTGSYRSVSSTNPRDFVAAAPSSSEADFNAYSPRTSSRDGRPARGNTAVPIRSCAL